MRKLGPLALSFAVTVVIASCSSSPGSGGSGGTTSGTGGITETGGSSATGGNASTGGGSSATGGNASTGGSSSSGGGTGTGGLKNTGGTGTGGAQNNGGSSGGAGGQASTGGTTGSGGTSSGGAGGGPGSGGSSSTGGTSGAVFFSDDFESDTSGKQPAGWDNLIAYNYKTTNPMGSLSGLADSTHTHNGSKLAAHFVSDGGMVFLERPLPSGTNHLFFRAYFYFKNSLGMQGSSDNHETLLGITADPTNANTEVRFGVIKGVIGTNQVPSDNIAPIMAKWNGPPVISAAAWHCIEVEFDGSAAYNTVNAWSDGMLVHSITKGSDWQNGALAGTWMSGMFNTVMFGWQSFSSLGNEIWVDDLVLSTARVGCN